MQLIDTRVSDAGTEVMVEFVGEGGESVLVRMSNEDHLLDDQNAIDHAEAVMVQLTAFDDSGATRPDESNSRPTRDDPLVDTESLLPSDLSH
ncbi:hypothetical protein [Rhizobium sp. BK176]|uniref:hypothetical protein n=1 Tax=Rhizobium sp. BK176 TaxID=2587071 RepID=UPI00216729B3|nr:hypothetical protein [Rhizobium sp. BK176]MCS4096441.1 hypothetical protein [Rhizobium sp. BK176]